MNILRLVVSVICFQLVAAHAADTKKPNIIFLLADDLGIPGIGSSGGAYKTPNIDALAKSGTRFEH